MDLGALPSGNTLTLHAVLTVTSTSSGSGFYGDVILGDPPAAPHTAAPQTAGTGKFVAAMAAFGGHGGASADLVRRDDLAPRTTLFAAARHISLA